MKMNSTPTGVSTPARATEMNQDYNDLTERIRTYVPETATSNSVSVAENPLLTPDEPSYLRAATGGNMTSSGVSKPPVRTLFPPAPPTKENHKESVVLDHEKSLPPVPITGLRMLSALRKNGTAIRPVQTDALDLLFNTIDLRNSDLHIYCAHKKTIHSAELLFHEWDKSPTHLETVKQFSAQFKEQRAHELDASFQDIILTLCGSKNALHSYQS